jgi:hypothetical protein
MADADRGREDRFSRGIWEETQMDQVSRGLSELQQNDCRAALAKFIDRHDLSDWGSTVKVEETSAAKYCVKIELTPPAESGLPTWSVNEIAVADASMNVAAEVERLLEAGYKERLLDAKVLERQ